MTMTIYLLTWGLSLTSTGIIMGALWWFRRRNTPIEVITSSPPREKKQKARNAYVPRAWKSYRGRPDRSPFYMFIMYGLFISGLIMLIGGPVHPSTLDAMDPLVQRAMAFMLCVGSGICIIGFTKGTRYFSPDADLRDCYRLAVIATPANVSTLAVYAVAVGNTAHWNLQLFGLGAGGILAVLCGHLLMGWDLHQETKRLDRRVAAALQAVMDRAPNDQNDY